MEMGRISVDFLKDWTDMQIEASNEYFSNSLGLLSDLVETKTYKEALGKEISYTSNAVACATDYARKNVELLEDARDRYSACLEQGMRSASGSARAQTSRRNSGTAKKAA